MNEKSKPISEIAIGLSTECSYGYYICTSDAELKPRWNVHLVDRTAGGHLAGFEL